jgi:ABC-2 type transport system permease protein
MKFLAIIENTIREGLARKTILGMFIVSTGAIVIALLFFENNSVRLLLPAKQPVNPGHANHVQTLQFFGATVLDIVWLNALIMLLIGFTCVGVFATASFITSIMEKGNIDLLLSKPVSRWVYVAGRYTGAVLIVFLEIIYLVLGLWVTAGLTLGTWDPTFLWSIVFITLCFAGVYGLVSLIGILTRSAWFGIILALAIFVTSLVISTAQFFVNLAESEYNHPTLNAVAFIFHCVSPSAVQLSKTLGHMLTSQPIEWTSLLVPIAIATAYLGFSCFAFSKKEF